MAEHTTLVAFMAHLKQGHTVPKPDTEEWKEHVTRISVPGRITEVSEEDYLYWLEVLPPKWMRGSHFCFGEGADDFRLFWEDTDGRFWTRQLTRTETVTFCCLARIPLPH